jgi:predicted phosphodiesterase
MNKIAVLVDIHGNLKALETALKIIREEQVDRNFVCGDVV